MTARASRAKTQVDSASKLIADASGTVTSSATLGFIDLQPLSGAYWAEAEDLFDRRVELRGVVESLSISSGTVAIVATIDEPNGTSPFEVGRLDLANVEAPGEWSMFIDLSGIPALDEAHPAARVFVGAEISDTASVALSCYARRVEAR